MNDLERVLSQAKHDWDADERRRARRSRGGRWARVALWAWAIALPVFVLIGFVYAAEVWCSPPDPDGGMLRDAEVCRGDDASLTIGIAQPVLVWLGGLGLLSWFARPARLVGGAGPD